MQRDHFLLMHCLIIFFVLSTNSVATAQQKHSNISLGSSLTPTKTSSWLSSSGVYAFGFYKRGNGYGVGVFVAGIAEKTVVWTARRDEPPVSNKATLLFTGTLVLRTAQDEDTNITDISQSAFYASMLDTGNFVLYNSRGDILWQSFASPTDTLLPNQTLVPGMQLISSVSKTDQSTGFFGLYMQPDGNLVQYPKDYHRVASAYWASNTAGMGDKVSVKLDLDGNLNIVGADGSNVRNITDGVNANRRAIRLIRLDWDGLFRLYSHDLSYSSSWSILWNSTTVRCAPWGLCGLNSYCVQNAVEPECNCLPGFARLNEDKYSGCERNFTQESCKNEDQKYSLTELKNTVSEDTSYSVLSKTSKEECELACRDDCSCEAVTLDNSECKKQRLPMRFGSAINSSAILFIKVEERTESPHTDETGDNRKRNKAWIPIVATVSAVAVVVLLGSFVRLMRRRNRSHVEEKAYSQEIQLLRLRDGKIGDDGPYDTMQGENQVGTQDLPLFPLDLTLKATQHFANENKLGEGGFGPVYKGTLADGTEIAVKRLSGTSGQGLREFKNEVTLIAKLQHKNLVRLLGCCIEGNELLLVYEYMPNKSLDVLLFDSTRSAQLDWKTRLSIINGIARGLLYLHEDSRLRIIHRDLKTSNVLLDHEMNPKISDFGMARIFGGNQIEANTKRVVGTYGYMAPEYAMEGLFSVKSDVFSFGVLLLEIISGRKNSGFYLSEYGRSLLNYTWKLWCEEQAQELIDPILVQSYDQAELLKYIHIGLLCVQEDPADRPTMSSVVVMIASDNLKLPQPTEPAFSVGRTVRSAQSASEVKVVSINEVTLSNVFPR